MITLDELYKLYKKCGSLTTDSRKITPGTMFFALKGDRFDGNDFALEALAQGAKCAIVDRATLDAASPGAGKGSCILVENVLTTLQKLAHYHRTHFNIPVLAITGTNGKTTTKELIDAVLSQKYRTIATEGNLNNHIGVPLTLMKINEKTEIAIVEMGASAPGEIASLVKLAEPTCGIVTNVGKAHLLGFGSFEGVKRTKGELYDYLRQIGGTIFYNEESEDLKGMLASRPGVVTCKYGTTRYEVSLIGRDEDSPYLSLKVHDRIIDTNLIGTYNVDNVLAAIAIGEYFEVPFGDTCKAIENYSPSNHRSQMLQTPYNTLIFDAYNANPTSMRASLDNFLQLPLENKWVILGDMLELGEDSLEEHKKIVELLQRQRSIETIILVGREFAHAARIIRPDRVQLFTTVEQLKDHFEKQRPEGASIFLKGSNSIRLSLLEGVL
jgi:UDP-N-acetylmuramoyl-tripeptide--D-alanyl-D-alanine ligase